MNCDLKVAQEILRVRLSQLVINEKYKGGSFKVPIHLALGHEAIAVAVDSIMEDDDKLILTHRNIHYNLARTKLLKPELDEYLLKKEGVAQGQLGSMNLANEDKNIVYTSSILGNNLAVAAGVALGEKVKGTNSLVIVVTGDGAMEEGSFYENLVFLKSNGLSCLVLVENNGWSLATTIDERRCNIDIRKIAESLSIRYEKLVDNDTYRYIEKLNALKQHVLESKTPAVVEIDLTTLGGYYVKAGENTKPRFINYHAGPAPEVSLKELPLIEESNSDPVFVLLKYFEQSVLEKTSSEILRKIEHEIH
ncbi:MAG: thiamine pyrophosphate-dependent enzyme [Dehalococcoidia bacterium]|jgi:pyruvate dehydrogenase E1 component alpha subunit